MDKVEFYGKITKLKKLPNPYKNGVPDSKGAHLIANYLQNMKIVLFKIDKLDIEVRSKEIRKLVIIFD